MAAINENTAQKYGRLNKVQDKPWASSNTDSTANQLIYPIGFGNDADHSGLAMVFEFNTLTKVGSTAYEKSLTGSGNVTSRNTSNGNIENTETSLARDGGAATLRNSSNNGLGLRATYKKTPISVVLPPPEAFSDSLDMTWNNTDMGGIGRTGDFLNSVAKGQKDAVVKQMAGSAIGVASKLSTALGGPDIKSWAQMATGLVENNYNEVAFSHVGNRSFPFKWTLVPRNEQEANIINALIHRFRWAALPELFDEKGENASFFKAPWTFDIHLIDINTGIQSSKYPKISTCALTKVDVDRTPHGKFNIVGNNQQSLALSLSLTFNELITLHKGQLGAGVDYSF